MNCKWETSEEGCVFISSLITPLVAPSHNLAPVSLRARAHTHAHAPPAPTMSRLASEFAKGLRGLKVKELAPYVGGFARANLTPGALYRRAYEHAHTATKAELDAGSVRPLFSTMGALFVGAYALAWPTVREGRGRERERVCARVQRVVGGGRAGGRERRGRRAAGVARMGRRWRGCTCAVASSRPPLSSAPPPLSRAAVRGRDVGAKRGRDARARASERERARSTPGSLTRPRLSFGPPGVRPHEGRAGGQAGGQSRALRDA